MEIEVTVKHDSIKIDKKAFSAILEGSSVVETKEYDQIIKIGKVSLVNLKKLARKANVPYPLFFAPLNIVLKQINNVETHILAKLPSKKEVALSSRGHLVDDDLKLILRDLSRKQEFLKNRIHQRVRERNQFVGILAKSKANLENQAKTILKYFDINKGFS